MTASLIPKERGTLHATTALLTPLGNGRYRLVLQNLISYVAAEADAALLDELAGKIREAVPGTRVRGYAPGGEHPYHRP